MNVRIKAISILFVLFHCVFGYSQATNPELVLVNGKIFTSNPKQPYVQAVAIQGERIAAVGTSEEIKHLAGKDTKIVDLGGRTVIPGIDDAHKHLFIAPQNSVEVDFKSFDPSWADAKRILAAALVSAPKGSFIYGDIGPTIFHDVTVDRTALDELSRDHPIILTTFTGHAGIVNSAALAAANVSEKEPDPLGGRYERAADGRLTGILREYAKFDFDRRLADRVPDDQPPTLKTTSPPRMRARTPLSQKELASIARFLAETADALRRQTASLKRPKQVRKAEDC